MVDAYKAGFNGEDLPRETRDNAAAGNYTEHVEAMYNAGLEDAKTGSVDTGVSEMRTAEASPGTDQFDTAKTEQPDTTTAQKPGNKVNPELEAKLAPFKLNVEERTAAEEYARTGKGSAISNEFNRDSVKRIMDAAEIIKEYNGKNGVDSKQGEGYNGNNGVGETVKYRRVQGGAGNNASRQGLMTFYRSIQSHKRTIEQSFLYEWDCAKTS